jgi:heat shock protein HslJ
MFELFRINQNTATAPSGPGGTGDLSYTHNQTTAATVWTVNHNLGKNPSVTVVDSAGTKVWGDEKHIDQNSLTITFSAAFSGKAYCN